MPSFRGRRQSLRPLIRLLTHFLLAHPSCLTRATVPDLRVADTLDFVDLV